MKREQLLDLHRAMVTVANLLMKTEDKLTEGLYDTIYDSIAVIHEDLNDVIEPPTKETYPVNYVPLGWTLDVQVEETEEV